MSSSTINRINLGLSTQDFQLPIENLALVQLESYQRFLEKNLTQVVVEISPIRDYTEKNFSLEIFDIQFGEPKFNPEQAVEKGVSYEVPLYAKAKLIDHEANQSQTQDVYLGEIPLMTERGTFVINGNERVVMNQLVRSPGVYFEGLFEPSLGRHLYTASLRPERGAWIEFSTSKKGVIWARINQVGRKITATTLLKAFGIRQREILRLITETPKDPAHEYLTQTLKADPALNQEEAFLEIYSKLRPGDPRILENAQDYFTALFLDPRRFSLGRVGRYKLNKRLGLQKDNLPQGSMLLTREDLTNTLKELLRLNLAQDEPDNIDHLSNRRVRTVGEIVEHAFRGGLLNLERLIRERLSVASTEKKLAPASLVNARPITAALKQFFGSSQLSQYMDQTNPLAELESLRKVTTMGPGGLTRERAGTTVRDVHTSHYGRLDVVTTPEGPNVGLNLHLALFARVNEFGFIEAPYRKVRKTKQSSIITDEIVYLPPDDEENFKIAEATLRVDAKNRILDDFVAVRFKGNFQFAKKEEVDFVDAQCNMMTGASSGSVPFISSDAGMRSIVGSKMLSQAVPLIAPEVPRVGTGIEKYIVRDSGRVVRAKKPGKVLKVDANEIQIETKNGLDKYPLTKFNRTNKDTCYNQIPCVKKGEKIKKDTVLVNGPSQIGGELALGRDLLIGYLAWDGFNYEDSIIISERLVKEDLLTSIHIKQYEAQIMDTKLGPEEITRDIPNVAEDVLRNLSEDGVVVVGAKVTPGDILVGKIAPKGETELTAEERLLRSIFGEKAREIRDTSLTIPHGEKGAVIAIQTLDKKEGDELGPGVLKLIRVFVAEKRKVSVGDKIAGKHGSKGVVAKIVREEDMPYTEDGTVLDILFNPVSLLARMNLGQILETHLGWAGKKLNEYYAVAAYDRFPAKLLSQKLKEAKLPADGKVSLYDGRNGQPFKNKVAVGYAHILKLDHMVEDKVHARSTGPYSLVTQQPLGGKAQMGGQRLGEMEVWGLEAYGAAHILQEMLTIKSDDVIGRTKAFEAIVKGINIPEARLPEAFKLLVKELNSLSLSVDALRFGEKDAEAVEELDAAQIIEEESKKD